MIPPSTAPISGAKGTSVDTLTRMPSARPATAPIAIAAPTLMPMNLSGAGLGQFRCHAVFARGPDTGGGYADAGYGTTLRRPIPRRFVFTAVPGSDLSPAEEGDISGIADKRVKTLVIRMSDDSKLSFSPTRAPKRVRKRHVWARGLRFFDEFFSSDLHPRSMKALNREGRVLGRERF
jgi:hypothetical protein